MSLRVDSNCKETAIIDRDIKGKGTKGRIKTKNKINRNKDKIAFKNFEVHRVT